MCLTWYCCGLVKGIKRGEIDIELLSQVSTEEMPSHSHTLNRNSNSGGESWCLVDHEGVTKWQTGDMGSAGGDTPHNNIQPVVAAFAWKRTA